VLLWVGPPALLPLKEAAARRESTAEEEFQQLLLLSVPSPADSADGEKRSLLAAWLSQLALPTGAAVTEASSWLPRAEASASCRARAGAGGIPGAPEAAAAAASPVAPPAAAAAESGTRASCAELQESREAEMSCRVAAPQLAERLGV
jgi:hypothetical protein